MRNGNKPRRDPSVDLVGDPTNLPPVEPPQLKSLPPLDPQDDVQQLGFDAFDSMDEPAEVLIRVSTEALEGEEDLIDEGQEIEGIDEPAETVSVAEIVAAVPEPEVQTVPEIDGSVAVEAIELEPNAVEPEPETQAEAEAVPVEPNAVEPEPQAVPVEAVEEVGSEAIEPAAVAQVDETADQRSADERFADDLSAQPVPYEAPEAQPVDDWALQIRLARIHLKTGSFVMARAELEALAARDKLDMPAHLDLAEVRWRTGDLHGAGEAAAAYIADGGEEALGFVIAAESSAMANRHAEARRFVEQALQRHLSELDPLFAGISRKATWATVSWNAVSPAVATAAPVVAPIVAEPAVTPEPVVEPEPVVAPAPAIEPEPVAVEPSVETEPVVETEAAVAVEPAVETEPVVETEAVVAPEEPVAAQIEPVIAPPVETPEPTAEDREAVIAAREASLAAREASVSAREDAAAPEIAVASHAVTPDGATEPLTAEQSAATQAGAEVESGTSFLKAGDPLMAALHFSVAIRLAPESAQAVLDAIGDRQDLALQLVRGDALRMLGLEGDAGQAYLSVASALGAPRPATPQVPVDTSTPDDPTARAELPESSDAETTEAATAPVEPEEPPKPPVDLLPPIRWD